MTLQRAQVCRGRVDHYVAPFLQLVLAKLSNTKNRTLKDTLMLVVANCLYYNAQLTLAALQQQGALQALFGLWFTMIFANKKSGKPKHFRRMHDKKVRPTATCGSRALVARLALQRQGALCTCLLKNVVGQSTPTPYPDGFFHASPAQVCVLGLVSVLASPDEALAPEIKAGLPQILSGITRLLVALKEQQDEALKEVDEDEDEDGVDDDWGNDDDDEGPEDDDKEEAYLKRLAKMAARETGQADDAADDDTDDEWTDDEEVETPIDPVDPYVFFADALAGMQATNPARHQGLTATVDAGAQEALAQIMQYAAQQRAEAAKKAAEAAAGGAQA